MVKLFEDDIDSYQPPSKKKIPSLQTVLNNEKDALNSILGKCQFINELNVKLKEFLDPTLKRHFKVANIDNSAVVIHADSAAYATKLRYNNAELLSLFRKVHGCAHIQRLKIVVRV